jgi:hypothetical protein
MALYLSNKNVKIGRRIECPGFIQTFLILLAAEVGLTC